jgi:hypothetical protein
MLYDLHIHSFYSDGEDSPENILKHALSLGIKGLAITDHNGMRLEVKQIVNKARKLGIEVFEGIEISSQISLINDNLNLHILGYSSNFNIRTLNKGLKKTVVGYKMRAKKIIKKCRALGIPINYNRLKKQSNEFYVSRNTIAQEIVKYRDIKFKEALKIAFVEEKENWFLSPFQAISLIKESGGIPVLAHSGKHTSKLLERASKSILEKLIDHGLKGIEVFYPTHNQSETKNLMDIARKYGLAITGGSDYHGSSRPPYVEIGTTGVDYKNFNEFKKALLV